jgi:hypothetical protein
MFRCRVYLLQQMQTFVHRCPLMIQLKSRYSLGCSRTRRWRDLCWLEHGPDTDFGQHFRLGTCNYRKRRGFIREEFVHKGQIFENRRLLVGPWALQ